MARSRSLESEAWVLSTEEGQALLELVRGVPAPRPADLARWRKLADADRVSAAIRLADGRRRGALKFSRADRMWFEPTGLEQATAESVARHKALRFAGRAGLVADLCCGIGGDALALARKSGPVVAVDLDEGMCQRVRWNARVYDLEDRVLPVQGRAEQFDVPRGSWIHIDPDRRAHSETQTLRVAHYSPDLDALRRIMSAAAGGAIKLGPASDFQTHFDRADLEVELISLGRECKEATVWFGALATCRRRATALHGGASWTDRDGPEQARAPVRSLNRYVFDPDAALRRAGLLDGFSVVHDLARFMGGVDYLTGPNWVKSPFLTGFEVVAEFPVDMKLLKRELLARGLGNVEVKTRGLALTPEVVRKRLGLEGPESGTLILVGSTSEPARALLARRLGDAKVGADPGATTTQTP